MAPRTIGLASDPQTATGSLDVGPPHLTTLMSVTTFAQPIIICSVSLSHIFSFKFSWSHVSLIIIFFYLTSLYFGS
jgi:hypothetical protein